MRRIVCQEFGPPDRLRLEEAPDPRPGAGEVLVKVRAAGVSFVDGLIAGGMYQLKPPLPFTPGLVGAGEVVATGEGVPALAAGRRVVGSSFGMGGYTSHWVLPADAVVPLPDAVTFEVAATAVESYATMLFAMTRRTAVQPGEWVLVLGAGGGIGLAAVDVARTLGARVIAAASTPAKRAAALQAGAQVAIDYETEDLKTRVREITGAAPAWSSIRSATRSPNPRCGACSPSAVTSSSASPAAPFPGCRSTACCWKTARSWASTGGPGPARTRRPTRP